MIYVVKPSVLKPGEFDVLDTRNDLSVETLKTRKEALAVRKIYEAAKNGPIKIPKKDQERLMGVAIIRKGTETRMDQGSHYQIRMRLGDDFPDQSRVWDGDQEGFWTSKDRFVDRDEGQELAVESGQISGKMERVMLSSDIRW